MANRRSSLLERAVTHWFRSTVRAGEPAPPSPARADDGLPVPPARLRSRVAGTDDLGWFLASGDAAAKHITALLERNGAPIQDLDAILDFGCGAGRVIRHWNHLEGPRIHGTDADDALVGWCARSLPFARVQHNPLVGTLAYPNESFDLISALSVFTHLGETVQAAWFEELDRVLKPGGHLYVTFHGDAYWTQLSPAEQRRYRQGEMVVRRVDREGSNDCAVFHPQAYVRRVLARRFEPREFLPEGAAGTPRQDAYLFRKLPARA